MVFFLLKILVTSMYRSLQPSLAMDLQLGLWDKVEQRNFFVLTRHINLVSFSFKDIRGMYRSLQHSLAGNLQLGCGCEVQQGDFCVLASAYNLVTWSI
jgi:hypothetical protein